MSWGEQRSNCNYCEKPYIRTHTNRKYCSDGCASAASSQRHRNKSTLPRPYVWIYELWGPGDEILYVGKTDNLERRLRQHESPQHDLETAGSQAWLEHKDVVARVVVDPAYEAKHVLKPKYP